MKNRLVTEIQSLGIRPDPHLLQRKGGAGPAEAGTFLIDDIAVSVPTCSPYVSDSPYSLRMGEKEGVLCKDGQPVAPVSFIPHPRFYDQSVSDGTPCANIALLHGKDCLATSVLQTCIYWDSDRRCRFCGIELSLRNQQTIALKTPDQLTETALLAKNLDGVRHVVLTAGTGKPPGREIALLGAAATAIKGTADLPVHVQILPTLEMERLRELKHAGVDTVGIHIESLDMEVLSRIAPVKRAIGLRRYEAAWKTAVEIFGPNQVSSFLIAGLGERPESVVSGSEYLTDLGVYPFVVPLRPIPGSWMEDARPPDPAMMADMYEQVARILEEGGLSSARSLAGCVRCGACSALPWYERPEPELSCHPARTSTEINEAFDIRTEVFVTEQNIFEITDRDDNDTRSIHLVARQDQEVIGTVRVFPAGNGNGHWIGGRLAVRKGYRATGAGELLVQRAVATVKKQGCTRFTAHIQQKNIPFFSRLGWKGVEVPKTYFGRIHQLMEADLDSEN